MKIKWPYQLIWVKCVQKCFCHCAFLLEQKPIDTESLPKISNHQNNQFKAMDCFIKEPTTREKKVFGRWTGRLLSFWGPLSSGVRLSNISFLFFHHQSPTFDVSKPFSGCKCCKSRAAMAAMDSLIQKNLTIISSIDMQQAFAKKSPKKHWPYFPWNTSCFIGTILMVY